MCTIIFGQEIPSYVTEFTNEDVFPQTDWRSLTSKYFPSLFSLILDAYSEPIRKIIQGRDFNAIPY